MDTTTVDDEEETVEAIPMVETDGEEPQDPHAEREAYFAKHADREVYWV